MMVGETAQHITNTAAKAVPRRLRPHWWVSVLLSIALLGTMVPAPVVARPVERLHSSTPMADAEWAEFQPEGWTTMATVTASVVATDTIGLNTATAEYQISVDGGMSWTEWGSDDLTIAGAITTSQTITVTNLALPDAADNQIAFRIEDTEGVTSTSPSFALAVDTTPPDNPIALASTSHALSVWSNDPTVDIQWDAGTDATSGVEGYAIAWDENALTLPDPTLTTDQLSISSAALAEGSDHYVHLRTSDSAGLWSANAIHLGPFWIDTIAPTSEITYPEEGQLYSNVTTINGTATEPGGSGLRLVEVSIRDDATGQYWDGLTWAPAEQGLVANGTAIWDLSGGLPPWADGQSYTVGSRANDFADNIEDPGDAVTFTIDSSGPPAPLNLAATPADWTSVDSFDLHWTNPTDPSGIAGAWYTLDSAPLSAVDGVYVAGADLTSVTGISAGGDGEHAVYLWLQDGLGNADHLQAAQTTLHLDSTAPGAPLGIAADPAGWTENDAFDVTWLNPDDLGGVAGAWYKLDSAPIHPTDGTFQAGDDLTTLDDVAVGSDGAHDLYVWLEDALGQSDHTMVATVVLSLDTTAPGAPQSLTIDPPGWSNTDAFDASWANPPDDSGVAGAWYRVGEPPGSSTDGVFVSGADLSDLDDLSAGADGEHDLFVWLEDALGHADHAAAAQAKLRLDTVAPDAPIGLVANPADWTNIDSFEVSWANPPEASGVSGAWYKVGDAPLAPDDGTFVSGEGLTGLAGVSAGEDGERELYVWLVDSAGNVDQMSAATTMLRLDTEAPGTPQQLTANPEGWSKVDDFSATWVNPEEKSGIVGVWFKVGEAPVSATDGTFLAGDGSEPLAGIAVGTDGAHDLHLWLEDALGQADHTVAAVTTLYLDTSAPGAPQSLGVDPAGWSDQDDFDIGWVNPDELSGVAGAWYKIGAPPTGPTDGTYVEGDGLEQLQGLSVGTDGEHEAHVWLQDAVGNVDHTQASIGILRLDRTAPAAPQGMEADPAAWTNNDSFGVSWTNPDEPSGVAGAWYKIGAAPTGPADGTFVAGEDLTELTGLSVGGDGEYPVYVWLEDGLGQSNHTEAAMVVLHLDTTAPGSPEGPEAVPEEWTNEDDFEAVWTNPGDLSGIAGAWYKIGAAPLAPTDGTFVAGADIAALDGLTAGMDGEQTAHIWLEDTAGNADHTTAGQVILRLDRVAPGTPVDLIGDPAGWTSQDSFAANWLNPGEMSGVAGAWYKIGEPPADPGDGVFVAGDDLNALSDIVLGSDGEHQLRVWLQDRAGNADHTAAASTALHLDTEAPGTPLDTAIDPVEWTSTDSFDVSWTNPADLSGVAGAWYRVGDAPTFPVDGTYVVGVGLTELVGIAVGSSGAHSVYVWLEDSLGQRDHTTAALLTAHLDTAAPGAPADLATDPAGWTSNDSFNVSWVNPVDDSGVAGAWYKVGDAPIAPDDGVYVAGEGIVELVGVSVGADGERELHVWLEDGVGNRDHTNAAVAVLYLDSAPPAGPVDLTVDPADWTNTDSFDASWTNPAELSGVAGAWYRIGDAPAHGQDGEFEVGEGLTQLADLAVGTDGEHTLYVWLEDALGQADHMQAAAATLYLDLEAPGAPTNLASAPQGWQSTNDFSVTWRNPADVSGVAGAYWRLNSDPSYPQDGTLVLGDDITTIDGISVPEEGQHDLYLWLQDGAGNKDHLNRNVLNKAFWFDGTPPSTYMQTEGLPGLSGWYRGPTESTFLVDDAASGAVGTSYRIDGGAWTDGTSFNLTEDGVYTVDYHSWDAAGNMEEVQTGTLAIDSLPPTSSYQLDVPENPTGWYSSTVTVTLSMTDTTSGPAAMLYRVDGGGWLAGVGVIELQLDTEGEHSVQYWSQDNAGNVEDVKELNLLVDTQPPSTAYQIVGEEGLAGWFTSPAQVSLIASDLITDVQATYYRINGGEWQEGTQFSVETDGVHTLEFYSVDSLSNMEQWFPVTLKIDTEAPGAPTRPLPTPSDWTNLNAFQIDWANPQDLSGIGGACYKLDSEPGSPVDGTCLDVTGNTIEGVEVPDEGVHDVFLWLRDGAGNSDHNNRNVALDALQYDATLPETTLTVIGDVGWNDWYTSPLTLQFEVQDALSGPEDAHYSIDGGPWQVDPEAYIMDEGKHVLQYYGQDIAGNQEISRTATLRVDLQPPGPPTEVEVTPAGWSTENDFRATWSNPLDLSGISAALYRFNSPPESPYDGTLVTSVTEISNMMAPSDGRHDLYLWLADGAGNAGITEYALVPDVVWLDTMPPTTTLEVAGTAGDAGWYTSDLSVTVNAVDPHSGVDEVHSRLDEAEWTTASSFEVTGSGQHQVEHYASDLAGNIAEPSTTWLNIDKQAPSADIVGLSPYQSTPNFEVSWYGHDGSLGSGVTGYDLQVRQGDSGPWLTWLVDTSLISAHFAGEIGRTYFFRVRAHDLAGHVGEYPPGDGNAHTSVQVVQNHDFETQDFDPWVLTGAMSGKSAVVEAESPGGTTAWVAQLGSPDYGPSTDLEQEGTVPDGSASISQNVTVPEASEMVAPTLSLWYRVFTYDVLWSAWHQRYYDSFDVTINSVDGTELALVLRDGNDAGDSPQVGIDFGVLIDLGWRHGSIDLRAYAGQTIKIVLANHNRWDHHYNTWTLVDDVQIVDSLRSSRRFLPLVSSGDATGAAAGAVVQPRASGVSRPR